MREDKKRRICPYWISKAGENTVNWCMATNRGICQHGDIHNFENCVYYQNYKKEMTELIPPTATAPRYPYYLGP